MSPYYEEHHHDYFTQTVGIDPSTFLEPVAGLLEPGASVLDIGCGAGRDLLWLASHGFRPTGFERSKSFAALARNHSQQPVIEGDFYQYDFSTLEFDAIICIGGLVHVAKQMFADILRAISLAVVPGGLLLVSMKEGVGTCSAGDGRIFTLWLRREIESVYRESGLDVLDFSRHESKLFADDTWLLHLLKRRF